MRTWAWVVIAILAASRGQAALTNIGPTGSGKAYYAGEVATAAATTYGRYEGVFKSASGSGLVTALFTFHSGPVTQANEIDIENLGLYGDRTSLNVFSYNNVAHQHDVSFCFDPHAGYQHYAIEWVPGAIRWYVDGALVYQDTGSYVAVEMIQPQRFMLNFWPSNSVGWAGAIDNSRLPAMAFYDWMAYSSYTPGTGNSGSNNDFTLQWRDDFNTLDTARWNVSNNTTFGGNAGDFSANNVNVVGGQLVLSVTQAPWAGYPGSIPTPAPTPTAYCPSPTPAPTASAALIIDDFSNQTQYNSSHANDLGLYTDDDASLGGDTANAGGQLALTLNASGYWYTVLSGACLNAAGYGTLALKVRGGVGSEKFDISLQDMGVGCATPQDHYLNSASYFTVTTTWQDVSIPLSAFGADLARVGNLVFANFTGSSLQFDDIRFIPAVIPTPTPTRTLTLASASPSPTRSPSTTLSVTTVATFSPSPTFSTTRTSTPSFSPSPTLSLSVTLSASPTVSLTRTPTPSATYSPTPTGSPTPSVAPSMSVSPSVTVTFSLSPTFSTTRTSTPSFSPSPTPSRSVTPSVSPSMSVSLSVTVTFSPSPTFSTTRTSTSSFSPSPTPSLSVTPSASPTGSLTRTPTLSATYSLTPIPSKKKGKPNLLAQAAVPNPNPQALAVSLENDVDESELRIYDVGMRLVSSIRQGPLSAGWTRLGLPTDWLEQAPNGLYYYRVRVRGDGEQVSGPVGKLVVLR